MSGNGKFKSNDTILSQPLSDIIPAPIIKIFDNNKVVIGGVDRDDEIEDEVFIYNEGSKRWDSSTSFDIDDDELLNVIEMVRTHRNDMSITFFVSDIMSFILRNHIII